MISDDLPFRMKINLPGQEDAIPIGKVLCIGRNYADHASEMESDVPEKPMVFLKPASAVIRNGEAIRLPSQSSEVHHEVELVAVIGKGGRQIPEEKALEHVAAYAVGIDVTARDIQSDAKSKQHPWSVAKGFDTFAPLGDLTPAEEVGNPQGITLRLTVNDEVRQEATTDDMIFSVAELVHHCSTIFTLAPGDLLYTGTPSGVGPIADGDALYATATGCTPLHVRVTR